MRCSGDSMLARHSESLLVATLRYAARSLASRPLAPVATSGLTHLATQRAAHTSRPFSGAVSSAAAAPPPPLAAAARTRVIAAASDSDGGTDAWLSFLTALHANGYFAAAASPEEEAAERPVSAPDSKARWPFGSPGDHKRAVLAHARARDSLLHLLPVRELEVLVECPVPTEIVDSTFGGRKAVNAVKRLRTHLGIATPKECAIARHGHPAQGEASLQDAARLVLCWCTTPLPRHVTAPNQAIQALLLVMKDMPAGEPRVFDASVGGGEHYGDRQRRAAPFGRREDTRRIDLDDIRYQRSSPVSRRDAPGSGRYPRSSESPWGPRAAAPRPRLDITLPVRADGSAIDFKESELRAVDGLEPDREDDGPAVPRMQRASAEQSSRSAKYERRFDMPPPPSADSEDGDALPPTPARERSWSTDQSRAAREAREPREPRARVSVSRPESTPPPAPASGGDDDDAPSSGMWAGLPK
jgi:hypothetical protein